MNKVIYIDFDGVLVDTPNMINNALKNSVNSFETCKNLAWNYFLKNCSEIENNFSCIEEISKKYKVVILTHVYSENELLEKEKFISNLFQNVDFVPVPYNIEKIKLLIQKEIY